jgi:hypothetical protein
MADVNIQAKLTVTKSNSMLQGTGNWDITQQTSTKRNSACVQNVTSSPATLTIAAVNPLGYLFVKNLGAVNVSLGLASGSQTFATVRPSEFCLVPPASNSIYAWTASSNADVQIVAAES